MPRDYSVTIKIRNNRLLEKMRAAGYETSADLSRASGVPLNSISVYLCLKLPPMTEKGNWRQHVLTISKHLRCLPEDLFPAAHLRAPLRKNVAEFKADASDICGISAALRSMALPADEKMMIRESKHALDCILDVLTPRERNVIEHRFGLVDGKERFLRDIPGERCTQERVRTIERKALRKLRTAMSSEPELARAARQVFNLQ
jgi:hypothetical protein